MKHALLVVLIALTLLPLVLSCSSGGYTGSTETITVAYSPFESTSLFWIALDQKYFDNNGLTVNLRKYETGVASLAGVMKGEADILVGLTEFPVVRMAFQGEKIAILSSANKGEFIYLIGRKDRGIEKPSDLKGKKVGTALGTIAQFHLGRFIELNGIREQDLTIIDLKTQDEWVNAVAEGKVDAVVTAQPDANKARDRLGANAVFWPVQSGQYMHGLVASATDWAKTHTGIASRFLKSLFQAEEYFVYNPAQSKMIVQKNLNLDAEYMETVWAQNQASLSLDQSLILAMEDEARWMMRHNLTSAKMVPNFLDYIYAESLKSVKPGAVKITGK